MDKRRQEGESTTGDSPDCCRYSELAIWSSGYGLATLMLTGLPRGMPQEERDGALERMMEMAPRGL